MKRSISIILLCMLITIMQVVPVLAIPSTDLPKAAVTIDGRKLAESAYIVEGRTMVPMRTIFEALDCTVEWDNPTQTVTALKGVKVIKLTIGKYEAFIDGKSYMLSAPPLLIDSRTFVPLRFVAESLNCDVGWDQPTWTAIVNTKPGTTAANPQAQASSPTTNTTPSAATGNTQTSTTPPAASTNPNAPSGNQVIHQGKIAPHGETWSPGTMHIVRGDFLVEGPNSPVLTVEAGAIVRFEKDASICVGNEAPGGLVVEGSATNPAVFTAYIAGAQPGHWSGIKFYSQAMRGKAVIENARIEYGGTPNSYGGAVYLESDGRLVEALLKNVEIKNSMNAGIYLYENARLAPGSSNLKISGTIGTGTEGGFPIITDAEGSGSLPVGEYKDNAANAVLLRGNSLEMGQNTTWTYIGIPYQVSSDLYIQGDANPVLTIQPGVEVRVANSCTIYVGDSSPGSLIAKGERSTSQTYKPVTFTDMAQRYGSWIGIDFGDYAGNCTLEYVSIMYAKIGAEIQNDMGGFIKNALFRNCSEYAIYRVYGTGGTSFMMGLGNQFEGNAKDENIE